MNIGFLNGQKVKQLEFGCEKMAICGSIRQNDEMVFKITDNRLRPGVRMLTYATYAEMKRTYAQHKTRL